MSLNLQMNMWYHVQYFVFGPPQGNYDHVSRHLARSLSHSLTLFAPGYLENPLVNNSLSYRGT